ncbi:MAG: phosphatase PAP2 family protein [Vicinamibacteria bacterium]
MSQPRVLRPDAALRRAFFGMRPEEAIAVLFLLPTTWITAVAHYFAPNSGAIGPKFAGGVLRLFVAILCAAILGLTARRRPEPGSALFMLREMLPFLLCVLIYTNLHDTIGFVNSNDIHDSLLTLDIWLFGVEPCLWAEQFYSRERTEVFQLLYMSFAFVAPAVPFLLLFRRRYDEFRHAALSIILCFYLGYGLYLILPAAPPRIAIAHEFTKNFVGDPIRDLVRGPAWPWETMAALETDDDAPGIPSQAANGALALLPTDSRAAFPSLHAGVSLLALGLAWRYVRGLFFVLLPLSLGLWASTIYLRHHFAVDLLAGFALAPVAYRLAPRLDAWWSRRRQGAPN